MQANRRFVVAMVAAAVLLGCTAVLGIVIGSTSVGIDDVLALAFGADADQTAANVIWNIRLPRVLAALLAGAALAQAGALIQAALDNPLASPNIIGVNAGSGFFVLLAACTFPNAFGLAPVAAFLGALCVAGLIFAVAGLGGSSRLTVVLAGMAFTSIFTAGMNTILIVNPDAYVGASGFLIGGLSGVKLDELIVPHAVRTLVGHDNRRVLAMAPLLGGLLVCLCDLLARTLFSPYEIPVGIVLSLLGGPFFVYLILRRGKGGLNG